MEKPIESKEQSQSSQTQQPPSPSPACFPIPNYSGVSIVDALKTIGVDSSYEYRCKIAARNGIGEGDYKARPHENLQMLDLLKQGKLIIP